MKANLNTARTRNEERRAQAEYKQIDCEVKRSARRDKRRWSENLARDAQAASETNRTRDLYKITRKLANKKPPTCKPLKRNDGELVTSSTGQMNIWVEYYSNMLRNRQREPHLPCNCDSHNIRQDVSTEPPSIDEIVDAINSLKNNKAPGIDNISPELLKADPLSSAHLICDIIRKLWDTENLCDELKEGIVIKLPKKGDLTDCRNWRGITLLSMVNKVIANILNKRLTSTLLLDIRSEQAGFRPNKSCIDHINSLRIIVEESVEWRSPLYMVFIDFEKAFDTLNHGVIWSLLACNGIPQKIINLIRALYHNASCRIQHENSFSNPIDVEIGVRQGCPLSPLLFNVVIDSVMRSATTESRGIAWSLNSRLEDLDYADDICLLSHKFSDMEAKLKAVETEAMKCGLKINIAKTKVMRINTRCDRKLTICGTELGEVTSFNYLGSVINTTGGSSEDVSSRIVKARQSFGQLNNIWRSNQISKRTKISLYNSCVKSVLLYGCETWNAASRDLNALQVFSNRCLRRIMRIFWPATISNIRLWEITKQQPIAKEIQKRKWRWIGHALRRPQGDVTRQSLDWTPQGTRRRGRPSHTWRRQLETEAIRANKSWNELKHLALNKTHWNTFIEALCSL